jgi:hypothetical protein
MRVSSSPGVQIVNNVVLSNTGCVTGGQGYAGGIYLAASDGAIVSGNRIEYNYGQEKEGFSGSYGGGIYFGSSDDVVFRDNVIRHNVASLTINNGYGGGMCVSNSNGILIEGNTLEYNQATGVGGGWGGGLMIFTHYGLLVNGNWILSNHAYLGAGVSVAGDASLTMTNNIVAENTSSGYGGGLAFYAYEPIDAVTATLLHNTFALNNQGAGEGRSAIHTHHPYVSLVLTNNLIYSHTYGVIAVTTSTVQLRRTLFYANGSDTSGPGTISNVDPVTGLDPYLNLHFHLSAGSPAIDKGVDAGVSTDFDGHPRPLRSGYDIGADEYGWECWLPLIARSY